VSVSHRLRIHISENRETLPERPAKFLDILFVDVVKKRDVLVLSLLSEEHLCVTRS
jgi:hypothetical protein